MWERLDLILSVLGILIFSLGLIRAFVKEAKEAITANRKVYDFLTEAQKDGLDEKEKARLVELSMDAARETVEAYESGFQVWMVIKKRLGIKKNKQ